MTGDRMTRVATTAVVMAVAAFAAAVSYNHIFTLGRMHGQDGAAARLLPPSIDGLIAAASLVMLSAARQRILAPALARWMLALGIGATIGANVLYGAPYGAVGAVVSAWPAVSFIGSVELLAWTIRAHVDAPKPAASGTGDPLLSVATETFGDGPVPSLRVIQRTLRVGQPRAQEVQAHLTRMQAGAVAS